MRYFFFITILFSQCASAQDFSAYEQHFFKRGGLHLPYRYLRPLHFDSSKKYPLIIFLHGAGHKGFDNEAPLQIGGRFFLRDSIRSTYPAFVLFPQCPSLALWAYFDVGQDAQGQDRMIFPFNKAPTEVSGVLMNLIDSLVHSNEIDTSRVYIGGLSQGGMGVLDLIARYPNTFAAAFSICGAGNEKTTKLFSHEVALWLFHGSEDDVVPVQFSRNYNEKLKKLGADVRYTEFKGVKHNSWSNAFAEPGLMQWLFSKQKRWHN